MTSPLISPESLADRLGDSRLRIVDLRWYLGRPGDGRAAYEAGHLPGAIHLDLDRDLAAHPGPGRHPLPTPAALAAHMAEVGIGDGDTVVGYDDVGGWVAARLWWMLDNLGFPNAFVLDGGIKAWTAAGLPVSTDAVEWPAARLTLGDRWTKIVERDELRDRLGSVVLLDARAGPRYRGEVEPVDPYAGHIPTALNRPTDQNLGPDGRFLPPDQLREQFLALRGGDEGELVTSCGSGTSAAHHILATRVAGLPDPILYPGSWSDWSRSNYPAATGAEPGDASQAWPEGRPGG